MEYDYFLEKFDHIFSFNDANNSIIKTDKLTAVFVDKLMNKNSQKFIAGLSKLNDLRASLKWADINYLIFFISCIELSIKNNYDKIIILFNYDFKPFVIQDSYKFAALDFRAFLISKDSFAEILSILKFCKKSFNDMIIIMCDKISDAEIKSIELMTISRKIENLLIYSACSANILKDVTDHIIDGLTECDNFINLIKKLILSNIYKIGCLNIFKQINCIIQSFDKVSIIFSMKEPDYSNLSDDEFENIQNEYYSYCDMINFAKTKFGNKIMEVE